MPLEDFLIGSMKLASVEKDELEFCEKLIIKALLKMGQTHRKPRLFDYITHGNLEHSFQCFFLSYFFTCQDKQLINTIN